MARLPLSMETLVALPFEGRQGWSAGEFVAWFQGMQDLAAELVARGLAPPDLDALVRTLVARWPH